MTDQPPRDQPKGAIGYCTRCRVTIVRDLPNRCTDHRCPGITPFPEKRNA